jgi:hypothetical protein
MHLPIPVQPTDTSTRIVFAVLVVAFATLVTVHITLALGLARRSPRWRGIVALFVAPLAPWWGWRARMRVRGSLWIAAATVYGVALGLSLRG